MTAPLSDQDLDHALIAADLVGHHDGVGACRDAAAAIRTLRRQRDEARKALEACEAAARSARKIQGVSEIPDNERSASYGYGLIVVTARAALAKAPSDAR